MKNPISTKLKRADINEINSLSLLLDGENDTVKEISRKKGKDKKRLKFNWLSNWRLNRHPDKSYIITMMFPNGTLKTWAIKTEKSTFQLGKKCFYLYTEESYFDLSLNQFHLYYNFNFCVPINREVQQMGTEAFFVCKPDNLKGVIDMEYVGRLASSNDKRYFVIIIIMAVIIIILLAMVILAYGKA